MFVYPKFQRRGEYLDEIVMRYKECYPMFSEHQIRMPIEKVVYLVELILDNDDLVPSSILRFNNAKVLLELFSYTQEAFSKLTSPLIPETVFSKLFYVGKGKENAIKFSLKDESFEYPQEQSELYRAFISEMTPVCVKEMAETMIKNTCYETKKKYEDILKQKHCGKQDMTGFQTEDNEMKQKKKVQWSMNLNDVRTIRVDSDQRAKRPLGVIADTGSETSKRRKVDM